MEFGDKCFRVSKNIARIMKNDRLLVTFDDRDDAVVFELEGCVADLLNLCDGSNSMQAIIDNLKLDIETEEEKKSFTEMLSFLQQHKIIEQV